MDKQTKQYLRQSAKDNKLLLQNQRKPATQFVRILPPSGYLSNINNQLLNYSNIDNDLLLKNQNISLESNPSEIPLQISTDDQQLVRTYVDNLPQNYSFQAEDGSIKYRKFQPPSEVPDLEEVDIDTKNKLEELSITTEERDNKLSGLKDKYNKIVQMIEKNKFLLKEIITEYKAGKFDDKTYEKYTLEIKDEQTNLQMQEKKLADEINKVSREFDIEISQYDDVVKNQSDIRARNLQKANAYQDTFNVYNQGAMSTQKEDFESEQDYLNRLQQNAEQLVPENELDNARQYVSKLFRQRMKDLILPDVIIEQVSNSVDPVSSDSVNNKQRLLNNWAYIKSKFLSTYGFNPKMSADEILDFLRFTSSLPIPKKGKVQEVIFMNPTNTEKQKKKKNIEEGLDKAVDSLTRQIQESRQIQGQGLGVTAEDFPKFVNFGSVLLELKKLHHHNQLVIKDHRKCAIYGFPSIKVSENFSNILINMVHKNEPSFSDLSRLNSHEKELYDVLISLAGLKKRIYNTHDNTISILKNRLSLLEGEIEIGNNNPKIYNEIRKLLFKLHHLKVISMKQVQSHLKQIG